MSSCFEKRFYFIRDDEREFTIDDLLLQAVDQYEKEETVLDYGLDEILS